MGWIAVAISGCGDDEGTGGTPREDGGAGRDAGPEEIILTRSMGCPLRGGSGNSVEANIGSETTITLSMTRVAPADETSGFALTSLAYRVFDTEIPDATLGRDVICEGGAAHELVLFEGPRDGDPPSTPEGARTVMVPEDVAANDPPEDCEPTEVCRGMAERLVAIDPPFEVAPGNALHVAVVVGEDPDARVCPALCFRSPAASWSATVRPEITTYNWTRYRIVDPTSGNQAVADVHLDARGLLREPAE